MVGTREGYRFDVRPQVLAGVIIPRFEIGISEASPTRVVVIVKSRSWEVVLLAIITIACVGLSMQTNAPFGMAAVCVLPPLILVLIFWALARRCMRTLREVIEE